MNSYENAFITANGNNQVKWDIKYILGPIVQPQSSFLYSELWLQQLDMLHISLN